MEDRPIKDSGERREFNTGAQRDLAVGKGRYDLISPVLIDRLAKHLEKGAIKYGDNNWTKGIPLHCFVDSLMRHTRKIVEGEVDEDHEAAIAFNIMGLIHTREMVSRGLLPKELDDLPTYTPKGDMEKFKENIQNQAPVQENDFRERISKKRVESADKLERLFRSVLDGTYNDGLKSSYCGPSLDEYTRDDDEGFPEDDYGSPVVKAMIDANIRMEARMKKSLETTLFTSPRIKAYLSHPIRGSKGKDATDEEMKANLDDAIKVCEQLRAGFPELDIYCPAEKDEALAYLLEKNYITIKQLLEADCNIIDRVDLVLYYTADVGLSGGMLVEHSHACSKNIPGRYFSKINDSIIAQIDNFINTRQERNSG